MRISHSNLNLLESGRENLRLYTFDVLQNIFPLTWVDEGADIDSDPDLLKEAKGFLVTPFVAVDAVMGVLIALGCVMIMGAIVNYIRIGRSANNC